MESPVNRMMNSSARDGHPSGTAKCPKCGKPLYYASRLATRDGEEQNVEYCSGGCGFTRPVVNDAEAVAKKEPAVQPAAETKA